MQQPHNLDPLTAMYAAVKQVEENGIDEIELEWSRETIDGSEERFSIRITKEPRFKLNHPSNNKEGDEP